MSPSDNEDDLTEDFSSSVENPPEGRDNLLKDLKDAINKIKRAASKFFSGSPNEISDQEAVLLKELESDIKNAALKAKIGEKMEEYKKEAGLKRKIYAKDNDGSMAYAFSSRNVEEHTKNSPLVLNLLNRIYDQYPQDDGLWRVLYSFFTQRVGSSHSLHAPLEILKIFQGNPILLRSIFKFMYEVKNYDSNAWGLLMKCRNFYESDNSKIEKITQSIKALEQREFRNRIVLMDGSGTYPDDIYIASNIGLTIKTYEEFQRAVDFLLTFSKSKTIPELDLVKRIKGRIR